MCRELCWVLQSLHGRSGCFINDAKGWWQIASLVPSLHGFTWRNHIPGVAHDWRRTHDHTDEILRIHDHRAQVGLAAFRACFPTVLDQGSASFFCKGTDSSCFGLCGPHWLCHRTVQLCCCSTTATQSKQMDIAEFQRNFVLQKKWAASDPRAVVH